MNLQASTPAKISNSTTAQRRSAEVLYGSGTGYSTDRPEIIPNLESDIPTFCISHLSEGLKKTLPEVGDWGTRQLEGGLGDLVVVLRL